MPTTKQITIDHQALSAQMYADAREHTRVFRILTSHTARWRTWRLNARTMQDRAAMQAATARRLMGIYP